MGTVEKGKVKMSCCLGGTNEVAIFLTPSFLQSSSIAVAEGMRNQILEVCSYVDVLSFCVGCNMGTRLHENYLSFI